MIYQLHLKFYVSWYWIKLMPVIQYLLSAKPSTYLLQTESSHYRRHFSSFRLNLVDTVPWVSERTSRSSKLSNFLRFLQLAFSFCLMFTVSASFAGAASWVTKNDLSVFLLPSFQFLLGALFFAWCMWYICSSYMTNRWIRMRKCLSL
jgi:hypothetical protein